MKFIDDNSTELYEIIYSDIDTINILRDIFTKLDLINISIDGNIDMKMYLSNTLLRDNNIITIDEGKRYLIISNKYATNLYIEKDGNRFSIKASDKYFSLDTKLYSVLLEVKNTLCNVWDFYSLYNRYSENYTDRDKILDFAKNYPFVPFTHCYCESDQYFYIGKMGYLYDKEHNIVDNFIFIPTKQEIDAWEYYNDTDSWFRRRNQGTWLHNWKIVKFDGWYDKTTGRYDDKHRFGDY